MKVIKLNVLGNSSDAYREAVKILKNGGTVVYPTDTIYGIGCNALDYKAVETVYRIKGRSLAKPLSVIARNMKWIKELAFIPTKLEPILEKLWPGAITVVLPRKDIIPSIVTAGMSNVGLRIPDFDLTDRLMGKFGYPLISTSANIADAGDSDSYSASRIMEVFKNRMWQPDLMLDAGDLPQSPASTIIDYSTVRPRLLRKGAVNPEQLKAILGIGVLIEN